jgi:RNA polymerase sigma-70 factor (ECF subfamily)
MTPSETDAAFQQLYRAERGRLLRYFSRKVGPDEAPDLTQEVFIRLLRSGAFERIEAPGAYLMRSARNLLIDRARRKMRAQGISCSFEDGRDAPVPPEQAWRIEEVDARRIYRRAVLAMPRRTRRIFLMHRLTDKTYCEIAEELGIADKSVDYHMMRALAQCRRATTSINAPSRSAPASAAKSSRSGLLSAAP